MGSEMCIRDSFGIRVETAKFLKVVIKLDLFHDFDDEIDSSNEPFHLSFQSDMRVGAALSKVCF